jgi:uncharacterized membrane protein
MVALLLRTGVILSGTLVTIGGAVYLWRHGTELADYHVFQGNQPADIRIVRDIILGAVAGRSQSIIQAGLLLLIATPIARVALSFAGFAMERDRKYLLITAIVLTVLLYSLISGATAG